jgi:hypothetical protein
VIQVHHLHLHPHHPKTTKMSPTPHPLELKELVSQVQGNKKVVNRQVSVGEVWMVIDL